MHNTIVKIFRICLNTAQNVYTVDELHEMSKTSRLSRRWDELLLTLMRKYYLADEGVAAAPAPVEGRTLRSDSKMLFALKRPITEGYKKSPTYRGRMLWNVQTEDLKLSLSKAQFKRKLKLIVNLREKYPKK